jgi:hypothetical protein
MQAAAIVLLNMAAQNSLDIHQTIKQTVSKGPEIV